MSLNDSFASAPKRGMIVRSKEILEPGLTIFKLGHRFVGSDRKSDEEILSTPWWLTSGTIETVARSASNAQEQLADVFRRFGAIAKRWGGSGDLIVKAKLAAPLNAYIGPGTVQDFRGVKGEIDNNRWDMPLWVPSAGLPQVYIPLAKKGDPASSVARSALRDIYIVPIDKWDESYVRAPPRDRWRL